MGFFQWFFDWLRSLLFGGKEMELCIVGLSQAGKTSLVNVLANNEFREDVIPTVGFTMRRVKKGGVSMKIWDLGGQKRFRGMWERYCRGVDAIIFVVDASARQSINDSSEAISDLLQKQALNDIPLLILGNKMDLNEALTISELKSALTLKNVEYRHVAYYDISCKTKHNIAVVLDWLIKLIKEKK